MALAFATRASRESTVSGGKKLRITRVTLDNSYPTGGYAITKPQLGFGASDTLDEVRVNTPGGFNFEWDYAANKLKAYSAMGTELANASAALNNLVVRITALGN